MDSPKAFREALLGLGDEVVRTVSEKMMIYALGRGLSYEDALVRQLMHSLRDDQYRWSTLIQGVVQSDQFQMRAAAPTDDCCPRRAPVIITRCTCLVGSCCAALARRWRSRPRRHGPGAHRAIEDGRGAGAAPWRFYVPNGMSMPYWFPKAEGLLKEMPPTLRSLAAFKDRVLLCGGLADEPANRVRGGGDHARSAGTFLTGVAFKLTSGADVFGSISMDQIAAKQLAKETQLASLELGIESNAMLGSCDGGASAYTNTVAWANETTPLPIENDPRAVFERLFGTSGSTDRGARLARIEQDRSILDFVSEQVAGLRMRIGPNDKARLTEYLDSIRDVERRIQMAEHQNSRELPVVEQPIGIPATTPSTPS